MTNLAFTYRTLLITLCCMILLITAGFTVH